ncbi:hypothetical protein, partial [Enterococcus faecalis]|uniref:hypothetical protein n=1 Tax=Enterococcus faecalis TaxID=1351 RepID=UPI0035DEAC4E
CSILFGEFRLISEGVSSVPAVYQFLILGQKSKVIFLPGSFFCYLSIRNDELCRINSDLSVS